MTDENSIAESADAVVTTHASVTIIDNDQAYGDVLLELRNDSDGYYVVFAQDIEAVHLGIDDARRLHEELGKMLAMVSPK